MFSDGVIKGEPVNEMGTELALYHVGVIPEVQVAVNEAVLLLQMFGLFVPIGVATFTVTTVVAVAAAQLLPYEILTV